MMKADPPLQRIEIHDVIADIPENDIVVEDRSKLGLFEPSESSLKLHTALIRCITMRMAAKSCATIDCAKASP